MGILDWFFGKKEKSMKKVDNVSTKVMAMVEDVQQPDAVTVNIVSTKVMAMIEKAIEETMAAEKAAAAANVDMPGGFGARASHERYSIVEAVEKSKERMTKLVAITDEIDIEIKKVAEKTKAIITKDSEVDELEKNIVKILADVAERIKGVKFYAIDVAMVAEDAARKTKAEADAKYSEAHASLGDPLIDASREMGKEYLIDGIRKEQRELNRAAENAKMMAIEAREARTRVAETVKTVTDAIYPLKELKQSLEGLLKNVI